MFDRYIKHFTTLNYFVITFLILIQINIASDKNEKFDPNSKKNEIIELGKGWSDGIKNQDVKIISDLYAEDSKYFPSDHKVLNGNKEITDYWSKILKYLVDIRINLESLQGTKDLLIESGNGIGIYYVTKTKVDTSFFNYVNVWQLQTNGKYKVLIDIYKDNKILD